MTAPHVTKRDIGLLLDTYIRATNVHEGDRLTALGRAFTAVMREGERHGWFSVVAPTSSTEPVGADCCDDTDQVVDEPVRLGHAPSVGEDACERGAVRGSGEAREFDLADVGEVPAVEQRQRGLEVQRFGFGHLATFAVGVILGNLVARRVAR